MTIRPAPRLQEPVGWTPKARGRWEDAPSALDLATRYRAPLESPKINAALGQAIGKSLGRSPKPPKSANVPGPAPRSGEKATTPAARRRWTGRSIGTEAATVSGRQTPHLRDAAPKRLETDIQGSILRYLDACPGVFARRMNSRVVTMPGKGGKPRLVRFGFEGCADIIGWVDACRYPRSGSSGFPCNPLYQAMHIPRFLAVECKRPNETLRPAQAAFLEQVRLAGGLAVAATSVDDVRMALGR